MTATPRRRAVATVTAAVVVAAVAPAATQGPAGALAAAPPSPVEATTAAAVDRQSGAGRTTTTVPRAGSSRGAASTTASSTTAPPTTAPGARAAAQRRVDVLRSDRAAVRSELDELDRRIESENAALAAAAAELEAARAAAEEAAGRVARAQLLAAAAREQVRDYAVRAFIRPPAQDSLAVLSLGEAEDAAYARDVLGIMAEVRRDVVTELAAAEQVAATQQAAARSTADVAAARESEARGRLEELQRLRGEQAQLADQLDERLDAALSESAALASIDARAAAELAARETALRAQAPATPPRTGSRAPGRGSTRPTTTVPRRQPSGSGPATTAPRPPTTRPPSRPPAGTVGWTDVTRVGGIWVHKSIAGNVRSLLDAATAAGFSLSGGGFRDPAEQIVLRRAHCGPTDYDVWTKPASQCRPPTARPGTSMHERGLAIDVMSSGRLITSRADPAFRWLQANAARYGFFNLPSEPWHWSTNGQ
jgi:hypothetical protein